MFTALFSLLIIVSPIFSQDSIPTIEWENVYDEEIHFPQFRSFIINEQDGAIIVDGNYQKLSSVYSDALIAKVDSTGKLIWHKDCSDLSGGAFIDGASCIKKTFDGNFIITGGFNLAMTNIYGVFLTKADPDGEIIFSEEYCNDTCLEVICDIVQLQDSGFICCGYRAINISDSSSPWLFRVNSKGDSLWSKIYLKNQSDDYGFKNISLDNDNGFSVIGDLKEGAGSYLLKLDSKGDSLWIKKYDEEISYFEKSNRGGFLMCGSRRRINPQDSVYAFLQHTDTTGEILWKKKYLTNQVEFIYANTIVQCPKNKWIAVAGSYIDSTDIHKTYVIKTDSTGVPIWKFFSQSDKKEHVASLKQYDDSSFIVAGNVGEGIDGWLMKITEKEQTGIQNEIPSNFLEQNNFIVSYDHGNISIHYNIPYSTTVKLEAYDIKGKLVKVITDKFMQKGSYSVNWDSKRFGSGIYFLKLSSNSSSVSKKVMVIK